MTSNSRVTLRGLADQYRRMAESETDRHERRKFLGYASVYDSLAAHREEPKRAPLGRTISGAISTALGAAIKKPERGH